MCYKKKIFRNPVLPEHRTGFDKPFVKVACCQCPACRKQKSNDWQVRAYYEFENNQNQAFFVTLDFDNEHLPHYHGVPCFDSDMMKDFLQRLRNRVGSFRYFYSTDCEGLLQRPHYHLMVIMKNMIVKEKFFDAVKKAWYYGEHEDIEDLDSVSGDKVRALNYISGYVSKDIVLSLEDKFKGFPKRFKHRTQASKHFGEQPLHDGRITKELLLKGDPIFLPVGKNGVLVPFRIPRYYEIKLAYDYTWHPELLKAELTKNAFGVQLDKVRHNGKYVYNLKSFFSSRFNDVPVDTNLFPDTSWKELVYLCLQDFEDFKEFLYIEDFCFHGENYMYDTLHGEYINFLHRPSWRLYRHCLSLYRSWKNSLDLVRCKIETDDLILRAKKRAWSVLKRNPQKFQYLKRKNFDFSKLKF